MKKLLVKLNRPVLINESQCEQIKMQPVYGFLAPNDEDDEDGGNELEEQIATYIGHLAAIHAWSTFDDVEFSVLNDEIWIDSEGEPHSVPDEWAFDIGEKYREKIGLDYTLYEIDLDEADGVCLYCGRTGSLITCGTLMDSLVQLVEEQERREEKQYGVILFNRPIWLPRKEFWHNEEGFCHVYGLVVRPDEIDKEDLKTYNTYLGYLAMCEEYLLAGVTPSGFSSEKDNPTIWYHNGIDYFVKGKEVEKECLLCKKKHNLKLRAAVVTVPEKDILEGVRDEMIVSQELYDSLLLTVAKANRESGCPK